MIDMIFLENDDVDLREDEDAVELLNSVDPRFDSDIENDGIFFDDEDEDDFDGEYDYEDDSTGDDDCDDEDDSCDEELYVEGGINIEDIIYNGDEDDKDEDDEDEDDKDDNDEDEEDKDDDERED